MQDTFIHLTIQEITNGYTYNLERKSYICHLCGKEFESGEIFKVEDRYFDAERMIKLHGRTEHPDMLDILLSHDKKYTGVTDKQKQLLRMIGSGMSDNEIAKQLGVASATIRHQKYMFREKAKQAKLFLSIYETAFSNKQYAAADQNEQMMDLHKGAKMVDERYFVTKAEEDKILLTMFSSFAPLRLKTFYTKEKNKLVVLRKITEQFERNRRYSEKEINSIIKEIYEDFATIRRYLIEYGFMERTKDCKEYWLI